MGEVVFAFVGASYLPAGARELRSARLSFRTVVSIIAVFAGINFTVSAFATIGVDDGAGSLFETGAIVFTSKRRQGDGIFSISDFADIVDELIAVAKFAGIERVITAFIKGRLAAVGDVPVIVDVIVFADDFASFIAAVRIVDVKIRIAARGAFIIAFAAVVWIVVDVDAFDAVAVCACERRRWAIGDAFAVRTNHVFTACVTASAAVGAIIL